MKNTKLLLILFFVLFGCHLFYAQDGSLDLSFDPGAGANALVSSTSIQSDGKIIVGGGFTEYNGTSRSRICRINSSTN